MRSKSQPELENESETETERQNGMVAGGISSGCAGLNQVYCEMYPGNCVWQLNACRQQQPFAAAGGTGTGISVTPDKVTINIPGLPEHEYEHKAVSGTSAQMQYASGTIPGNPGMQYERETESETENGMPSYQGGGVGGMPFERETESESENESEMPGMGYQGGGMSGVPGVPGMQYEHESETETQNGASHTYEYEQDSNMPGGFAHIVDNGGGILVDTGSGLHPIAPMPAYPAYTDNGVVDPVGHGVVDPVGPVGPTAEQKLQCLAKSDAEQCAAVLICEWDSRDICVPRNVPLATQPASIACSNIKDMIPCVDADGCQWNIHTQSCKIFRTMVLRQIRSCNGIARPSCSEYFGCKWDVTQQKCASERNLLAGEIFNTHAQFLGTTGGFKEAHEDLYNDYTEPESSGAAPSSMNCLTKGVGECRRVAGCFWDSRKICLPNAMQLETTRAPAKLNPNHDDHVNTFFHPTTQQDTPGATPTDPDVPNKAAFFHPSRTDPLSPPGAPGRGNQDTGMGALSGGTASGIPLPIDLDTETESENESEYTNMIGPGVNIAPTSINTCFYHPDRQTCLQDTGCFWDRRTHLCASLDVPNFLPATCEGFLYEAPCTLDKRCIWKTGECEEMNLDCEDITTRDRCLRTKFNGIPCVWGQHEQECDEAPILLRKRASKKSSSHQSAEFFHLWPLLIIVPFVFIVFSLARKAYSSRDLPQDDLLLGDVFHRVI